MHSRYLCWRKPRNSVNLHCTPFNATHENGILLFRNGRYDYCTNPIFTFLGCTHLKLPFNIYIALVQSLYRGGRKPWIRQIYIVCPIRRRMKPVFCVPVTLGLIIAPTQSIQFWVLHTRSFVLIYTMHRCNHGTVAEGSPEIGKFTLYTLYGDAWKRYFPVP